MIINFIFLKTFTILKFTKKKESFIKNLYIQYNELLLYKKKLSKKEKDVFQKSDYFSILVKVWMYKRKVWKQWSHKGL